MRSNTAVKKLGSLQRGPLLGLIGAYRTTSTAALQVLAGLPPFDLELLPDSLRRETMKKSTENMLKTWQVRWDATQKGMWTYQCFPNIRQRLSLPIALGHEVSQLLTGHGNFNDKLAALGLRPSPICACGTGDEDVRHVIFDCPIHAPHRAKLELATHRADFLWPCSMVDMTTNKGTYNALTKFAKEAVYFERPPAMT